MVSSLQFLKLTNEKITMNRTYSIENSKEKLAKDIETLHEIHPMKKEVFYAGKVIPPVSIAREYNKYICRMHLLMDDLHNNISTFPHLKKQVFSLINNQKHSNILSTSTSDITNVLLSLKENCLHTFQEFCQHLEMHNTDQSNNNMA